MYFEYLVIFELFTTYFNFFFILTKPLFIFTFQRKKNFINMNIWIISSWLQTNSTTPYVQ